MKDSKHSRIIKEMLDKIPTLPNRPEGENRCKFHVADKTYIFDCIDSEWVFNRII